MTVAPMNGDELPSYRRSAYLNREKKQKSGKVKTEYTKQEQKAMTKALFSVMLPRMFMILAGFCLAGLLVYLWLS